MLQKVFIFIVISILAITVFGWTVYYFWVNRETAFIHDEPKKQQPVYEIVGWQTYTNTKQGFEFKYPPTWRIGKDRSFISSDDRSTEIFEVDIEIKNHEYIRSITISFIKKTLNERLLSEYEHVTGNSRSEDFYSTDYSGKKITSHTLDNEAYRYVFVFPFDKYHFYILINSVGSSDDGKSILPSDDEVEGFINSFSKIGNQ